MGIAKSILSYATSRLIWPFLKRAGEQTQWHERWNASAPQGNVDIWLHTASVGEITPLYDIIASSPYRIGISVTSGRSLAAVQQKFGAVADVVPLPIPDSPGFTRLINSWQPKRLILMEAEAWPAMLALFPESIKSLAVLDGRVRFPNGMQWKRLFKRAPAEGLIGIFVKSDQEADAFRKLGGPETKISSGLHLKLLTPASTCDPEHMSLFEHKDTPIVVAGSIHPQDAEIIAEAWTIFRQKAEARLVVVPRHINNAEHIRDILKSTNPSVSIWPTIDEITIVPSFGLLSGFYSQAALAIIGGAWANKGGHNPVEAAVHGIPIIMGPHHHNQAALMPMLADQLRMTRSADELGHALLELLREPQQPEHRTQHFQRSRTEIEVMVKQAFEL